MCDACSEHFSVVANEAYPQDSKHPRMFQVCSPECARSVLCDFTPGESQFLCRYPLLTGADRVVGEGTSHVSGTLGEGFRSAFERNVAEWFCRNHARLIYEPATFQIDGPRGTLYYTPDFLDLDSRVFVEVKGVWAGGQRKKLPLCLDQYPSMRLLFLHWGLAQAFGGNGDGQELGETHKVPSWRRRHHASR